MLPHSLESGLFKQLSDLDGAFIQYEQNLDIPTLQINYPSFLVEAANKCREMNRLLSPMDLGWGETISQDFIEVLVDLKFQISGEIGKLIQHKREVTKGTSIQEINYWVVFRNSLERADQTMSSFEIQLLQHTLETHNQFKYGGFEELNALKTKLKQVAGISDVLHSLGVNRLFSCTELPQLNVETMDVFKKLRDLVSQKAYPTARMRDFFICLNQDIVRQCASILEKTPLMMEPFPVFTRKISECIAVFQTLYSEQTSFWQVLREEMRKRNEKDPISIQESHQAMKKRLDRIHKFRSEHEQYVSLLETLSDDPSQIEIANHAYQLVQNISVTDVSEKASKEWTQLVEEYNQLMRQIDQRQVETIKTLFDHVKSKEQIFSHYSQFSKLSFRPVVRGMSMMMNDE